MSGEHGADQDLPELPPLRVQRQHGAQGQGRHGGERVQPVAGVHLLPLTRPGLQLLQRETSLAGAVTGMDHQTSGTLYCTTYLDFMQ